METEFCASWGCLGAVKSDLTELFSAEYNPSIDISSAERNYLEKCALALKKIERFFPAKYIDLLKWLHYEYDFFNIKTLLKAKYYSIDSLYLINLLFSPPVCEAEYNSISDLYNNSVFTFTAEADNMCEKYDFAVVELFIDAAYLQMITGVIDVTGLPGQSYLRRFITERLAELRITLEYLDQYKAEIPAGVTNILQKTEKHLKIVQGSQPFVYDMYNPLYYLEYFMKQKNNLRMKLKRFSEIRGN